MVLQLKQGSVAEQKEQPKKGSVEPSVEIHEGECLNLWQLWNLS